MRLALFRTRRPGPRTCRTPAPRSPWRSYLALTALAASCTAGPQGAAPPISTPSLVPGAHWTAASPRDQGFDPAKLARVADFAQEHDASCFLVVHDGRLVGEWYWDGTTADTRMPVFSISKSVTSTVVGIAQDEGLLSIDEPASHYVETWRDTPSASVTARNLLSNDSGRHWDYHTDYDRLLEATRQTQFAIDLPGVEQPQAHPPGSVWEYNNSAIQVLDRVVERATGQDFRAYARDKLFAPIGMDATYAVDWDSSAIVYGGVRSTCRGVARFGLLALHHGTWGDRQIVSRAWFEAATSPSTPLNAAYGYLWWLNREGHVRSPTLTGTAFEGEGQMFGDALPESFFSAIGRFDQIVGIFPDEQVVFVRIGRASGRPFFSRELATRVYQALETDAAARVR